MIDLRGMVDGILVSHKMDSMSFFFPVGKQNKNNNKEIRIVVPQSIKF